MQTKDGRGFELREDFFQESRPFKEVGLEVSKGNFYSLTPGYFEALQNTTQWMGHQYFYQVVTPFFLEGYYTMFLGFFQIYLFCDK